MNKSLTILAGAAVLLVGLPAGTLPQARAASGTFADVPADHWAYEAVDTLQKAGIVIGYPDGTYGGKRAMTRYEFAEAIARLLPLLNTDTSNLATKDDLAAMQADLQAKLDANSAAIAALQQLVNGFQPELTALGVDVDAIKARLDALEARVAAVEAEQARVKITGDLNIIGRANTISKGFEAIDQNGGELFRENDTNGNEPGASSNRMFQADDVYNDFLLGIKGRLNDQATANILIDFGNYLSEVGNTVAPGYEPGNGGIDDIGESNIFPGTLDPGNQETTIWEAYLATPTGFGPLGQGDVKVGRLPVQWTNYTLKSDDADVYTSLYQTDSGNIPVDGAQVNLHTGPVSWDGWAGKFSAIPFAQPYGGAAFYGSFEYEAAKSHIIDPLDFADQLGVGLEPYTHAEGFDQGAGLRGTFGGDNSKFGISLEQFALNFALVDPEDEFTEFPKVYNRVTVYGADYNGTLPVLKSLGLGLKASINDAAFGDGSGFNNVESGWRNTETDDQLAIQVGSVAVQGGYKYIGPDYSAPGYWGSIGSWVNPTDIEGPVASASIKLAKTTGLDLGWADYQDAYDVTKQGFPYALPLAKGDHVSQYTIGTGFNVTPRDVFGVKYEADDFNLKNDFVEGLGRPLEQSGDPTQTFLTFSLDHKINENASFKFIYQTFAFDDKGTDYAAEFEDIGDGDPGSTQGQTAVGQFSLHF